MSFAKTLLLYYRRKHNDLPIDATLNTIAHARSSRSAKKLTHSVSE